MSCIAEKKTVNWAVSGGFRPKLQCKVILLKCSLVCMYICTARRIYIYNCIPVLEMIQCGLLHAHLMLKGIIKCMTMYTDRRQTVYVRYVNVRHMNKKNE